MLHTKAFLSAKKQELVDLQPNGLRGYMVNKFLNDVFKLRLSTAEGIILILAFII